MLRKNNFKEWFMNKFKGIVIIVAALISFLLMWFLRLAPLGQHLSGWNFAYSIMAVCALLFGSVVGGSIGILSSVLFFIFSPVPFDVLTILLIVATGFYGFILGLIFEKKLKPVTTNNMVSNIGIFIVSTILLSFARYIVGSVINFFRFRDRLGLEFSEWVGPVIPQFLISSLVVAIIGLLGTFVYHKCFKGKNPLFVEGEAPVSLNAIMPKLTARMLSKVGLSLTAIGFFLPAVENANVFTAMGNLSQVASWLGINLGAFPFFVYLVFISSVAGGVLLVLLYTGKPINSKLEWATVLTASVSFIIVLSVLSNQLNNLTRGASSSVFTHAQFGIYLIIIGLIASTVFMFMASFMSDTNTKTANNPIDFSSTFKKCPFCANDIKKEAIVCQFCSRDLPKE